MTYDILFKFVLCYSKLFSNIFCPRRIKIEFKLKNIRISKIAAK